MLPKPEIIRRAREALLPRPEVLEAYLFGSVARDQAGPISDIDIAVYLSHEPDAPYGFDSILCGDLMAAFETNDVDLVVLNRADPLLYHRVLRDGERILSRDLRATTTREGYAISRYCDFRVHQDIIARAHAARIARGDFGR